MDGIVGTIWESDSGNRWKVIAQDGDFVTVRRLYTKSLGRWEAIAGHDDYRWHVKSITDVSGMRQLA